MPKKRPQFPALQKRSEFLIYENPKVVFLGIGIYNGAGGTPHYFGQLSSYGPPKEGQGDFDLCFALTQLEARRHNANKNDDGKVWKTGDISNRTYSPDRVKAEATKQFRDFYPEGRVLLLGNKTTAEPLEIVHAATDCQAFVYGPNDIWNRYFARGAKGNVSFERAWFALFRQLVEACK